MTHPLDRPVWNALTTRQKCFAIGDARAVRFDPAIGLFAAAVDASAESLAALAFLLPDGGEIGLVEIGRPALPPGASIIRQAPCVQMIAERLTVAAPAFDFEPLGEADAAEMLELATLTTPGPFFERTHELGAFIGVSRDGVLVSMAANG